LTTGGLLVRFSNLDSPSDSPTEEIRWICSNITVKELFHYNTQLILNER